MGEYIDGIKIGTCESMYYARITDLQKMGVKALPYLDPANGFRYRFPFPEEDNIIVGHYDPYNKGLLVFLSSGLAPKLNALLTSEEIDHYEICKGVSYNNAINVNVFFPCPLSHNPPKNMSKNGASHAVVIRQLKQVDGKLWTVVDCPYCGRAFRLDKELAEELALCAAHMDINKPYWQEVSARILDGYNE
jgi:hypothetical protein